MKEPVGYENSEPEGLDPFEMEGPDPDEQIPCERHSPLPAIRSCFAYALACDARWKLMAVVGALTYSTQQRTWSHSQLIVRTVVCGQSESRNASADTDADWAEHKSGHEETRHEQLVCLCSWPVAHAQ